MKKTMHMFIGGPADGKWFDVPDGEFAWQVAEHSTTSFCDEEMLGSPGEFPRLKMHTYRREGLRLRDHGFDRDLKDVSLFIHKELSVLGAFARLVRFYRPKGGKEDKP